MPPAHGGAGHAAPVNGGPANGVPHRAPEPGARPFGPPRGTGAPPSSNGGPAPVNGGPATQGARPPGPRANGVPAIPSRREPLDDDEPTVVHGDLGVAGAADLADPDSSAEAPRHRRRAGASPDSRPAAEYRQQAEAGGRKGRTGRRRRPTFWKELPLLVVVALLMTFLIQTFLAKVYVIPSGSMETTLHGCTGCNNDRVLVDKVVYEFSAPEPGDVVVFRGPNGWTNEFSSQPTSNALLRGLQQFGSLVGLAPPDEKDFVKRVIAVGGQTVQCCDSRNRVLVDGEPLEEPYIYYLPEAGPARQASFGPITVPAGELWMMGDSRNNSADSRVPGHGPVPVDNVIGKARWIVLPFPRFGGIEAVDPTPVALPASDAGAGAPLALGLLGVLPLAARRRRGGDDGFLPGRR